MENATERRAARRFTMALPMLVRLNNGSGPVETSEQTRDVSFRGIYFLTDRPYAAGENIEFVLTLPREITMAGDVKIRCFGQVMRVESQNAPAGVAARIERYEFLPV